MKEKINLLMLALTAVLASLCVSSCGGDDDEGNGYSGPAVEIGENGIGSDGLKYSLDSQGNVATVVPNDYKLSNVNVPDKVRRGDVEYRVVALAQDCFNECTTLKTVKLPNTIVSLGISCFKYCENLESVNIPSSVSRIEKSCFKYCKRLTAIEIPASVTFIGDNCFKDCESLKTVVIPSSLTTLEDCLFEGCESLTSVTIPSSVVSIGDGCFWNCENLQSLVIPSSVTSIGGQCFYGCKNINKLTCQATKPPYVGTYYNDGNVDLALSVSCSIYVPKSALSAYKSAEGWNKYSNYFAIEN